MAPGPELAPGRAEHDGRTCSTIFWHMVGQKMRVGAAAVLLGVLVLAGCSSDGSDGSAPGSTGDGAKTTTTTTSASTTRPLADAKSSDDAFPDGLRDVRYCEILLLRKADDRFVGEVWNTLGLNDCPQADWDELDGAAIAKERGAVAAIENGPRYWTLDAIISDIRATAPETRFGNLGMFQAATIDLGTSLPSQEPYAERGITRETLFRFRKGHEVYELTDPDGKRYVMQSYSQIEDPGLTIDDLPGLGDRLHLPEGWSYDAHVLDADLDVESIDGVATVIQDELKNTYQLIDEGNR